VQSILASEGHLENQIFWPAMAASSVVLVVRNRSRIGKLILPPHIICLLVYLAFAGASALWAYKPQLSFMRFTLEVMILASVILPTMLAARTADVMGGVFLCFGFGLILNVLLGPYEAGNYGGYFLDKNGFGPHLTRRSRAGLRRFAADNPAHSRIVTQALGVVHILVSGKATKSQLRLCQSTVPIQCRRKSYRFSHHRAYPPAAHHRSWHDGRTTAD